MVVSCLTLVLLHLYMTYSTVVMVSLIIFLECVMSVDINLLPPPLYRMSFDSLWTVLQITLCGC